MLTLSHMAVLPLSSELTVLLPVQVKANVLVLGLANSGKTTLVNCLLDEHDEEVVPTVGFNLEKLQVDRCKLTVIDMSGQEKYQLLWEMQYADTKVNTYIPLLLAIGL